VFLLAWDPTGTTNAIDYTWRVWDLEQLREHEDAMGPGTREVLLTRAGAAYQSLGLELDQLSTLVTILTTEFAPLTTVAWGSFDAETVREGLRDNGVGADAEVLEFETYSGGDGGPEGDASRVIGAFDVPA